jgi:hypothetical protein
MENRLIHNPIEQDIDFSSVNFELSEFQEISDMARKFCDKP